MKKFNKAGRSFTTVVAGAAVIAVFGSTTAVAGSLITSAQIKNNTVRSVDVRDNALLSKDVRDNALRGADVADGSLAGADVQDGSLAGADVQDSSLTGADIQAGSVTGVDVQDGALTNNDVNVYYAAVLSNGDLGPNSGGITVNKTATGEYIVDFGRSIGTCAVTATVGSPTSAVEVHGEADVTAQLLNTEGVHVYTRSAGTTTAADLPFMVNAVC